MNLLWFFFGWLLHEDFVSDQAAQKRLDDERKKAFYQEQEIEYESHPSFEDS